MILEGKLVNVVNCRKCGKLFNYIAGNKICPMCKEAAEEKFQEVKKYIQTHGRCGMQEVCEACEVDAGQIQNWIRQERLQFSDDSPIRVACENCGTMIGSGKYCKKCKDDLAKTLNGLMAPKGQPVDTPKKTDNKNRMRFISE